MYAAKAPSGWRRDGSLDSLHRAAQHRYQVDNPHSRKAVSQERARSTSINRVVYPAWWGENSDQEDQPRRHKVAKRLKSADINKAKINKNIARHCEDTLDKRLREVQEGVVNIQN